MKRNLAVVAVLAVSATLAIASPVQAASQKCQILQLVTDEPGNTLQVAYAGEAAQQIPDFEIRSADWGFDWDSLFHQDSHVFTEGGRVTVQDDFDEVLVTVYMKDGKTRFQCSLKFG